MLTEFKGLTQKEMAEKFELLISGVKSRVQRARERLQGMLLECCNFEIDRLGNIHDYQTKENTCHCSAGDQTWEVIVRPF